MTDRTPKKLKNPLSEGGGSIGFRGFYPSGVHEREDTK
jgi:hypothetical protein